MANGWQGKRVMVTGSGGFLGRHLCAALEQQGSSVIAYSGRGSDLRNTPLVQGMLDRWLPIDVLFHLAADVGGIADNIQRPAELLYNNVLINANVVDVAVRSEVGKFIAVGSSCAYPRNATQPYVEADYLAGEPEPTNAAYAYSKRLLLTHLQAAHAQYGLPYTYLILANLYGEGCETDPKRAHVIGALVRKFYEAARDGAREVVLWGSPDTVRDFLYVGDAVRALMRSVELGDHAGVYNIGSQTDYTIGGIAHTLAYFWNYTGRIVWDGHQPRGSAARVLNTGKADLWFRQQTLLVAGLGKVVDWYKHTQLVTA